MIPGSNPGAASKEIERYLKSKIRTLKKIRIMVIILPKQVGTEEGKLLFQKSEKVEDFNKGREIVDSLKKTLEHYGGVGLKF